MIFASRLLTEIVYQVKSFSNGWAAKGINVNAIAPGYISTDVSPSHSSFPNDLIDWIVQMNEALLADADRSRSILERIPAGRWGSPDDFEGAVVYLASKASDYVSGECVVVDGGWMGSESAHRLAVHRELIVVQDRYCLYQGHAQRRERRLLRLLSSFDCIICFWKRRKWQLRCIGLRPRVKDLLWSVERQKFEAITLAGQSAREPRHDPNIIIFEECGLADGQSAPQSGSQGEYCSLPDAFVLLVIGLSGPHLFAGGTTRSSPSLCWGFHCDVSGHLSSSQC